MEVSGIKYWVPLTEIRMVGKMKSAASLRGKCVCGGEGSSDKFNSHDYHKKNLIVEINEVICSISHIW